MEPNLRSFHDHEDEEKLLADVVTLRSQLRKTERSLHGVGEELHSINLHDDSDVSVDGRELEILTMEDLDDCSELKNSFTRNTMDKMSLHNKDSSVKSKSQSYSMSLDKSMEEENELLRDRLNVVRGKNASLTSQNHHLMNKTETLNFELNQAKARISFLESVLSTRSVSIPVLEEQIATLEGEIQAQDNILKEAENKLHQSQKIVMEKEYVLQKLKEENRNIKLDLLEQSKQGKRTEQQRNEALYNAEELTRAFKKYKEKITEKLEKVQVEEQTLERNLMNCVKEKEKLQIKCSSYKCELENMKEQMRQLIEENCITKENLECVEAKNSEVELLLKHSEQKIQMLENKLQDHDRELEDKNVLINENADLKALIAQQDDHLKLYHQEMENSKIELQTLENIISQLTQNSSEEVNVSKHNSKEASCLNCCESNRLLVEDLKLKVQMKETVIQKLQAECIASKISQDPPDKNGEVHSLEIEPVKLMGNQTEIKYQQLELVSRQFEKEKRRLIGHLEELRTKLKQSEDENSFLKENMAQRTSQFQAIQEELLEKAAKSSSLEQQAARKAAQLLTLEKQLEEKTVAYTTVSEKNVELGQELMEANSRLLSLEKKLNEEHQHFCLMLEKAKVIHLEQHKEMENQVELLQSQLETKTQQFLEQENIVSVLQQDILCKQHHIESLDQLLRESKEKMEEQRTKKDEALRTLQGQLTEETIRVKQLQKTLDIYKEDLALYLSQLEENKELFEKQLKKKSEEVQRLKKEIKLKNDHLQSTCEQNLILQQTLQQEQQMLQEETFKNEELEESQARLQKQVLKLDKELQKQKEELEEELRKTNEKLHLASEETDLKKQKVTELTSTIRQIKIEMDQCKDELIDMEKELVHLRRDGHAKAMQLSHLEMTLEQKVSELQKKTQEVKDLEDKLQLNESQHKDDMMKIEMLEADLQNANEELKNTLKQLQDLRDLLQNAQMSLEDKYAAIQDLTEELRECKDELEDKKQELLDLDKVLKERNWDLKQRAAQVTQLDMAIREHKGELEQKIISLEGNLEKAELQIKECNKQIKSLESKLQHSKDELHEKEFNLLQQDQEINCLKKEIDRKQQRIIGFEQKLKEQEKCMKERYKEILDLGQQLRLEREQMKNLHMELLESRRQQAQTQRDVDRLSLELEELNHLSQEKESRANYLAEQLGASQARETQLEARMQAEIKRLSEEIQLLKQTYTSEKCLHEAQQTKWEQSLSKSYHLYGQLKQLKLELEDAQGTVCNLQQQLQSRNEMIHAANEALLLKESEVTRLQTRIAGHERTEGIKQLSVPQKLSSHQWLDDQQLSFDKLSQISHSTQRKLCHSTSSNDPNDKDKGNTLDLKHMFTLDSVVGRMPKDAGPSSPKSLNESSFDPLTHVVEEDVTCDRNDFSSLSGMLKYINKEMNSGSSSL